MTITVKDASGTTQTIKTNDDLATAAGTPSTNVLTVQGSASGAALPVSVSNLPATQPVSGTVSVSNFPATQPVSGSITSTPAALPSGTDRSGSITTGGTAQQLAASNAARKALVGQNIDASADLWINETGGTAAANTAGSFKVPAGATFSVSTASAISIVGATTGQKFTATEV